MRTRASCLYTGTVVHHRLKPRSHHLTYRVFSLLLDLDELPTLDGSLRFFSHNRFNLLSFYDRDHGPGDGASLRDWVERQLAPAGIDLDGGPIRLLCYPRVLGYVFNPLSIYFCHRPDGRLNAILYQVNNTFGERHCYLIPVDPEQDGVLRHKCRKRLYVSPFITMEAMYHFRIRPPGERLTVAIRETDAEGPLLYAATRGRRRPFADRELLAAFLRFPLMTLKVIGGIHWEAFRIWRKGVPLVSRPPPPDRPVTIVPQTSLRSAESMR